MNKNIIILFHFIALGLLLGHNCIPHHHDNLYHETSEQHNANHHENDKENDDFTPSVYHFNHTSTNFTALKHSESNFVFSKELVVSLAIISNNFIIKDNLIPPQYSSRPARPPICLSPHVLSSGLRAPPVFLG